MKMNVSPVTSSAPPVLNRDEREDEYAGVEAEGVPDDRRGVEEVEPRRVRLRAELHDQEQQREDDADEGEQAGPDGEQHLDGLSAGHSETHGDLRYEQSEADAGDHVEELGDTDSQAPAPS